MKRQNETPTFNMKVVVQETGLKPDTLRAWERRYGMPAPERTAGGHRLYSQHEIDMLKWLIARQDEGLSISNAIELWQQMEEEGQDPLVAMPLEESEEGSVYVAPVSGDAISQLRNDWIAACLNFEEQRAQQILAQAFAIFPLETVCVEILQKSLTEIGIGWYEGRVSVQQEHFASALAIRQLEALLAAMSTGVRHGRILVACPSHEQHTFSPLMITLMLRRRGWDVVYLGANVPTERLEATVSTVRPQLVILAAQTLTTAGSLLEMANQLAGMGVPLAFGGAVFNAIPAARERIPGHFLGTDLQAVPKAVENLLQNGPPDIPAPQQTPPAYAAALRQFRENRSAIEADVHVHLHREDVPTDYLNNANEDFGNNIEAALALGGMNLMQANIEWIQGLLMNYHYRMPDQAIGAYVDTYQQSAHAHLDQDAQPLLDWLDILAQDTPPRLQS